MKAMISIEARPATSKMMQEFRSEMKSDLSRLEERMNSGFSDVKSEFHDVRSEAEGLRSEV